MASLTAGKIPFKDTMDEVNRLESISADPKKPYESMYKARDVLLMLKASLCVKLDASSEKDKADNAATQNIQRGVINFRLGRNHLDTEESGDAEKHLNLALQVLLPSKWVDQLEKCRDLLNDETKKDSKEVEAILVPLDVDVTRVPTHEYIPETIDALNQSGILWTRRGDLKRALLLLEMSHRLYRMVVTQLEKNNTDESNAPNVFKDLNNLNMHTLFFLAQVHGALGNQIESAACCHQTLFMQHESKSYDPVEWAKNAESLSQHYMLSGDLERAERCLKAAQQIASEGPLPPEDATEDEKFGHPTLKIKADIHSAWGRLLGATLEAASENWNERKSQDEKDQSEEKETKSETTAAVAAVAVSQDDDDDDDDEEEEPSASKDPLGGGLILLQGAFAWKGRTCPEIEDVKTFVQARDLFRRSRAEYMKALEFYVLDGYVTDHVTLQQGVSKLYHSLAAFESDVKRIAAMEKRRIVLLRPIANDINNEHYVLKTKELWYECAQAAQEIHETYYTSVEATFQTGGFPQPKDMQKSDEAIFMSINFYEYFLKTMFTKEGQHPEILDKDNLPSVLSAHFAMARLYGHGLGGASSNTTMRVEMLKKALEKHIWLVEFAERNIPTALKAMEEEATLEGEDPKQIRKSGLFELELRVCKEMIELLPQRITQINNGLA